MILLDRNQFSHQFVKYLATWTTGKCGVNRWSWNNNQNICGAFRCGLLRHPWFGISFEVQRVVRRVIGILKLRLGLVDLEGIMSVFLQ